MLKARKVLLKAASKSVEYWSHAAMRFFVRDLGQRMEDLKMSRAELARKLDSSSAYVTKVMRGDVNFTLETMTKLAIAVQSRLVVRIEPELAAIANVTRTSCWHVRQKPPLVVDMKVQETLVDPDKMAANEKYNKVAYIKTRRAA
jgi:transcriptional regulator with XRE-family HTH domain